MFSHHLVAGNLHLNVVADAYTPEIQDALEPFVYELVGEHAPLVFRSVPFLTLFSQHLIEALSPQNMA